MAQRINKRQSRTKQADLGLADTCTALYIRVSTQLQAEEGFSLEAQKDKLQAHCVAQGWHVCPDHIYIDAGVSGKTDDRPAFQRMMVAAAAGQVQRIVATKLDRIARNTGDFLTIAKQLEKWGCALALVKENFETSTPQGKFAITLFAAIAEMEASMITERVMSGKQQKASAGSTKGHYNGSGCPLGYNYAAGEFSINEGQAVTVRRIFDAFLAGAKLSAIAQDLNDEQIATAKGGKWYAGTVRYILTNGIYAGIAQWYADAEKEESKIVVEGVYPAIISKDVYKAAHKRLQALRPGIQLESKIEQRLHAV